MFSARVTLLGASIVYGAPAFSVAFGLLHGVGFDRTLHLHVDPLAAALDGLIGFFLAWLRERTGSLVVPVIAHNATNLIFEGVPGIF